MEIYNHWVTTAVTTLHLSPRDLDTITATYDQVRETGFPYIVLAEPSSDEVLGLVYATHYKGERAAYRGTADMSLFLSPKIVGKGHGGKLLDALVEGLKARKGDEFVREVIATMAVADEGKDARRFYLKYGFEEVGHLRRVGRKMDKWVDIKLFQLTLVDEEWYEANP